MRPKLFSDSHQDTALSYHCLGESQYALDDFDGALESLLQLQLLEMIFYWSSFAHSRHWELLGRTYKALGEHDLSSQHMCN